jgi:hypothetical protein
LPASSLVLYRYKQQKALDAYHIHSVSVVWDIHTCPKEEYGYVYSQTKSHWLAAAERTKKRGLAQSSESLTERFVLTVGTCITIHLLVQIHLLIPALNPVRG